MAVHHLAAANAAYLGQLRELLQSLDDELYQRSFPPAFKSGVGPHVRHTLDHACALVESWKQGRIDYDHRERGTAVESDREAACRLIESLAEGLREIREEDGGRELQIKVDGGGDVSEDQHWSTTTLKRELQFLTSHTVHHYAIMAALLRVIGVEPGEEFGVAPSTLKYEKRLPCAR